MRSTHPAADITSTVTDVDNQLTLTEAVDSCQRIMAQLSDSEDQLRLLSDLFVSYLQAKSIPAVPQDFLQLAVAGMECLKEAFRPNLIYKLAKALGTTRPDASGPLIPVSRMPMGLLEHIVCFYTASSIRQVSISTCTRCYVTPLILN